MLTAYETAEVHKSVVEELWEYAFDVYDRMCKEAVPESTTDENRELMRSYLLGERQVKQRRR